MTPKGPWTLSEIDAFLEDARVPLRIAVNGASGHPILVSPVHREAALCGTCHDVSNPAFEKDISGDYVPNAFDAPATNFSACFIDLSYSPLRSSCLASQYRASF